MKNTLLWNADVFAIGQTQFNKSEFDAWLTQNDFTSFGEATNLMPAGSPIGNLWRNVNEPDAIERMIEFGGRHCYRAWEQGRDRSTYIKNIIEMEHGSVLEHSTINWAIQGVSRSLSLELARHRVGIALSQESQRFVDASEINFVVPPILAHLAGGAQDAPIIAQFHKDNIRALDSYKQLQARIIERLENEMQRGGRNRKASTMQQKRSNEAARAILPNCTETRFLWTTNMRLLRHFLWLRGGSGADLEIRRLAVELLEQAQHRAPSVFCDMTTKRVDNDYGVPVIVSVDG